MPQVGSVEVDYSQIKVQLSPTEKAQLAAAQKQRDDSHAALDRRENEIEEQTARLAGRASALVLHARRVAASTTANASAALNGTIPKYQAFLADLEKRNPAWYASWSSEAWKVCPFNPSRRRYSAMRTGS